MAAFDFSPAQAAANTAEGQPASVSIQSLLLQIDAAALCLVRTQFQHIKERRYFVTFLAFTSFFQAAYCCS